MKNKIKYKAKVAGVVNGEKLEVLGSGFLSEKEGITQGFYDLISLPYKFHPNLLCAMVITGYPNACRDSKDAKNIFHGKNYEYKRVLKFRDGKGEIILYANIKKEEDFYDTTFEINGNINVSELESPESLIEDWEGVKEGSVRGNFSMLWKGKDGSNLVVDTESNYEIDTDDTQEDFLHRLIKLESEINGNTLKLTQQMKLVKQIPL